MDAKKDIEKIIAKKKLLTAWLIAFVVLRPGFGPGSPARKAGILNLAIFGRAHCCACFSTGAVSGATMQNV